MPCTVPCGFSVAISDSRQGTRTLHTSLLPFSDPTVNSENEAASEVLYSASAAAIFIGCCESISRAWMSPVTAVAIPAVSATTRPIRMARPNTSTCDLRARCQPLTAISTAPVTMKEAKNTCGHAASTVELVSSAKMLVSSTRWVPGTTRKPTGCCIQLLAARMKNADMDVPKAASQIMARCSRGESRFHPKIHRPMKVDSMKKASSASMASGAPNTLPTNSEYADQFMPNWNSCTIPVTTPTAKLIRKILPKNLVSLR